MLAGAIGIVISFLIGSLAGLMSAPILIVAGLGMGVFYSRRRPGNAIITGALIYLFSFLISFIVSVQLFQVDIMGIAKESVEQMIPMLESVLKQSGASEQNIAKRPEAVQRDAGCLALSALPVALLIGVTLLAFVNHWFVRPLIKRFVKDMLRS
nr:DUF2232 domain-containing protein [Bacillus pumilus]